MPTIRDVTVSGEYFKADVRYVAEKRQSGLGADLRCVLHERRLWADSDQRCIAHKSTLRAETGPSLQSV
jgi:hypothetical protein